MLSTEHQRSLVIAGAILFLLGLIQGGVVHSFTNPRMALSAHLTAVQSGMALMLAGIVCSAAAFRPGIAFAVRLSLVAGMYLLWLGLTISAATGAGDVLPIAGANFSSGPISNLIVTTSVLGGSVLMTAGWLLLVTGLINAR